jgi:hypothetical protein
MKDTKMEIALRGRDFDCIRQMKLWMIAINIASPEELDAITSAKKKC